MATKNTHDQILFHLTYQKKFILDVVVDIRLIRTKLRRNRKRTISVVSLTEGIIHFALAICLVLVANLVAQVTNSRMRCSRNK